jgi:hypothetical protein
MDSRFNLVQAPPQQPGHCWITHTSVGPFIDTGVDVSVGKIDRGRIYISIDTLREMAQVAGLFDEKEPVTVELRRKEWFDQGYQAAMKEMSGDAVDRFIEHVSRNAVGLAGNSAMVESAINLSAAGAAVPSVESATAGTPESVKDVGGPELEGASASSGKRSSGISTNSSDDSQYRL